jgi:hypothetical protein
LLGAKTVKATTTNGTEFISVESSRLNLPQPLPDDYSFTIQPNIFTTRISLMVDGQVLEIRVGGFQKTLLIEYLNSRRYVRLAQKLDDEFHQMMSEDLYLNNRRLSQWVSETTTLVEEFKNIRKLDCGWVTRLANFLDEATLRREQHNKAFIATSNQFYTGYWFNLTKFCISIKSHCYNLFKGC